MRWVLLVLVVLFPQLVLAEISDFSVSPAEGPTGSEVVVSASWSGNSGTLYLFDENNNQLGDRNTCDGSPCTISRTVFPEVSTSYYPFFVGDDGNSAQLPEKSFTVSSNAPPSIPTFRVASDILSISVPLEFDVEVTENHGVRSCFLHPRPLSFRPIPLHSTLLSHGPSTTHRI